MAEKKDNKIEEIKKRLKIKSIGPLRKFFCCYDHNKVIVLDGRVVDWYHKLEENFSERELFAIHEFAEEHQNELPYSLVQNMRSKIGYLKSKEWLNNLTSIKPGYINYEERVASKLLN
ncbi:hypothetical protein HY448_02340 [Candidatus Pacearchaeota archaeon]|nr:hypothetical protein [Candidatus Pacearchaeota archaeon]